MILSALALSVVLAAAPQAATQPVRVVLLVPSGYPAYVDFEQARGVVENWTALVQQWFIREVGLTFDAQVELRYSPHDIYWLSANGTYLDRCPYAPIPEGQGASWDHVWNDVVNGLGWCQDCDAREIVVMVGAGGWAGAGFWKPRGITVGRALVGDYGLHDDLLGSPDPCDVWPYYGQSWTTFGHELLHAMNVDADDPNVMGGDPLSDAQRRDLKKWNKTFLRTP